ncbi:nucleotide exchange factor GrpE [Brucepastera parasyntrophica]|nr:nucleotide exchange factor GrpE [Brucepastera parasyntrophica]ULQ58849.1 nucleotide exchange factor GrpE [Brucepastera parasyntrophica]
MKKHEEKEEISGPDYEKKLSEPDTEAVVEQAAGKPGEKETAAEGTDSPENLEKKCAELQDLYLRKVADFDNYRKRMIKEKQDAIDYANTNLLVDLIQVLDDFDRAIEAGASPDTGSLSAFVDGVIMIRKQMASMLENKYGLVYYPTVGEVFDPNIQEAIGSVTAPEVKEPTVAEEYVKGYKLKGRVIRLAKVMVAMPEQPDK